MSGMKLNAVACKVKALNGKRLRAEDYSRLAAMKSVPEIAAYLRGCPGWQKAMEQLPAGEIRRGDLEDALMAQIEDEYMRLYKFMTSDARLFLMVYIYRSDYQQILFALRRIQVGGRPGRKPALPDFYLKHTTVNNDALDACTDFLGLLKAIEGSIFYEPLRALIATDGAEHPDYTRVGLTLQTVYYITMLEYVGSNTSGKEKEILLEALAGTIDLTNVVHVMRIRKFFPGSVSSVTQLLIPRFFKLSPDFFRKLYDAPDMRRADEMLRSSAYGKLFSENEFDYIEQYEALWKYNFGKAQLNAWPPTIYMLIAYISLKMYEMSRLIYIIECVRYGLPVDTGATLATAAYMF